MGEVPETRYAKARDGVHLAYQIVGEGPPDLVFVPGFISHLDIAWDEPFFVRFLRGLAGFSRLIWFDKAGIGLSDPVPDATSLDRSVEDLRTVMDAAESDKATLFGVALGASICVLCALAHPERVTSLILWGGHARLLRQADYPMGWTQGFLESVISGIDNRWATGSGVELMNPTLAGDERYGSWYARYARAAASPSVARDVLRTCAGVDLRPTLEQIQVPTLLLHHTDDPWVSVDHSRYLAERIPDAKLVELPGVDHWPWIGDQDAVLIEVEAFLTGNRRSRRDRPVSGPDSLTRREREVATLAVQALTARDIAEQLFISERTAETHLANAYAKLGIGSRLELVKRASEFGL